MFRGFTFGLFTENHNTPATSSTVAAEAASRLSSQPPPSSQVSNSSVSPGGRSGKQTVRGQSKVTLKPDFRDPSPGNMDEDIVVEGPEREEVDVKEESEVLPDGTLHSTQRVSHHKIKHVTRTHTDPGGKEDVVEEDVEVPGTSKEDVYELFEHPPKLVQESEDIEQVLDDGRKVKKHVVMNRMVHLVKMHHESFDEEHHKTEEDYEIEEVIPGTESAFVTGLDSDSDEDEPSLPKGQTPSGAGASGTDPAPNVYDDKDTSYPKLVSYQYGSDVDGGGYLRSKPGESTLDVVDDMLATGRLTLDDFEAGRGREGADTADKSGRQPVVIVISEDPTPPAGEDQDVLSYFGINYEQASSSPWEVEHDFPEEDEDMQEMQETTTGVALQFSHPKALSSLDSYDTEQEFVESVVPSVHTSTSKDFVDRTEVSSEAEPLQEEAAVGSTTETVRSTFSGDYHRTEIEITEKETIITDRTVVTEECTTMSPFSQEDGEGRMPAAEPDRDDADTGLPESSLFSPFDTHREEVLQTDKEERHVEENYFEQLESQGARQHMEEEDFVEAHEVLPTELDSMQATETVADTTFDQEESLQPSFQKPDQETVLDDVEQEDRYREAEDDISQTQQQPASSDVDLCHLSDEKEQESTEAEAVLRTDQYVEKDTEDYFETEEHTKEDADLGFESEQREELDGSEKHEAEEHESEHFSEASDEVLVEQTEESVGEDLQVKQTIGVLPDAATTVADEQSDHEEAEETEVHLTSEDAVCPALEAEEQVIEETYELSQAAHIPQTEQLEQVAYEGPDTSELEAPADMQMEEDDEGKYDEEKASAFETTGSEEQREQEDEELIADFQVTEDETAVHAEDKPPCLDSQWTEETAAELKDEDQEMETEGTDKLYFDTGAEVPEEQDEEWEILDKAELTEEEQIAALDETLMLAVTSQDEQSVTEAQEVSDQTVEPDHDAFLLEKSDEGEEQRRETESVIQDQPLMSAEEEEQSEREGDVLETEDKTHTEVTEVQELELMKEEFYQEVVTTTEQTSKLSYEIREQTDDLQDISDQQDDTCKQMLADEERLLEEEQLKEPEAPLQKEVAYAEEPEVDLLNFEEDKADEDMKDGDEEEHHVVQAEEKIHSEALLHTETHVFEAEGFTREIDDMKSPAMSQSTESTEAQMLSSEEALFATSSQPEPDLMATKDTTKVEQRPEAEQFTEAKLPEQYSDDKEEELEPLKLSGTDSPTKEPTPDVTQDSVDQSDRPELEALEPQLSPTFGRSSDQQVHRSPLEEEVETQPQGETIGEDARQSNLQDKQSELFEEQTEIEQVAVCGILAEIQDMEQYAAEEESEEEAEDGLEQYEEEPCQQQTAASQQLFKAQDRYEEDQTMPTDDMGSEELADAKDKTETLQAHIQFSAESQEFVDRVESFSLEERDSSVQHRDTTRMQKDEAEEEMTSDQYVDRAETFLEETVETTEMKEEEQQQRDVTMSDEVYVDRTEHIVEETFETTHADKEDEDEQDEGFSADMYVDRTERFVEEPVDTLMGRGDAAADGSIPEVTGMESAVSDSEDQQSPAQKDSDSRDHTQDFTEQQYAPPSPDEPQDSCGASSGREASSTGFTYSYTSQLTSVSHSYASESTACHGSESDPTSYTKTQEAAMTGYEFKQESRMSEETVIEQTFEGRREEYRQTELYEEDLSERPMSPSEYTLITSQAGQPEGRRTLDLHPEERIIEEEVTDRRDSPADEAVTAEGPGWEQPPSPTEYTLVSSQEQEALAEVLGLPAEAAAVSAPQMENVDSQESGEEALIQFSDSTDAAPSDPSRNQHVEKVSELTDDFAAHTEPSAPDMSPSSETKGMVRSSSYENLYQNISAMSESPFDTETAQDLDIGDRFDTRHTEPHLQSVGRTSSFEDLYDTGATPPATAPAPAPGGGEVLGAAAAAAAAADEDRVSSASSDAARLDDMEDGAAGPEDRSIRTDEEESGDDNIDGGLHGDEDESYTHRVVMKKEVHQKTTIKADGQEETVITEDSQVHQDSEPPEDLRQSMEEIIQHFMHDSPQMPRVHGVDDDHHDDAAHGDEGTEV